MYTRTSDLGTSCQAHDMSQCSFFDMSNGKGHVHGHFNSFKGNCPEFTLPQYDKPGVTKGHKRLKDN